MCIYNSFAGVSYLFESGEYVLNKIIYCRSNIVGFVALMSIGQNDLQGQCGQRDQPPGITTCEEKPRKCSNANCVF